jgi:transcriptional regulator
LTVKISAPRFSKAADAMHEPNTDVIQGTLDMIILKTLSLGSLHGYGIAKRVEEITQHVFKVNPGSLLTALKRMERAGWLDSEWRKTENGRRGKYYALTAEGRKRLTAETEDWRRRSAALGRLLMTEA